MRSRSTRRLICLLCLALVGYLPGCGGGGGTPAPAGPGAQSAPASPPPALAVASPPRAEAGTAYPPWQLSVTGGTAPFSFALAGGALPAGLTLTSDGWISGTPVSAAGSPFRFTVEVTDARSQTARADYELTVLPPAPRLLAASLPDGTVGVAYPSQTLPAADGSPPLHFALAAGALPDGLVLAPDGVLNGTPASETGSPFSFTIRVTDAEGRSATQDYVISIAPAVVLTTGLNTMMSQGQERSFYLRLPSDYSPQAPPRPILFAFHGTDGDHRRWLPGGLYGDGLLTAIGDQAILVFPDATPVGQAPVRQFSRDTDGQFFKDLLDYLAQELIVDPNRVFVVGQSSGAGFAHQLGCDYGDIVRGIAPAAGALIPRSCVGSTAVMMIVGENDQLVPLSLVEPSRRFWVAYNGLEIGQFQPSPIPQCVDHGLGVSAYPVYWCLHPGEGPANHNFPGFAAAAIWQFFSSLPLATPTADPPPGGGNDRVTADLPTTLTVALDFPATIGPVYRMAIALYEAGWRPGTFSAPIFFMQSNPPFDPVVPGTRQVLSSPVSLPPDLPPFQYPGTYVIAISIYVVGGSYPIPLPGHDHFAWYELELDAPTTPIVIPEPLAVEPYPQR